MKYIELTQGQRAMVDDSDYEWLSKFKWYAKCKKNRKKTTWYAQRGIVINGKQYDVGMHRVILGLQQGDKTCADHIDCNGLNNQRINLRASTKQQNAHNRSKYKGKSKYIGVCWHKTNSMWMANLKIGDKRKYAYFKTEEEAAKQRDLWAIEFHGNFAKLNFPV